MICRTGKDIQLLLLISLVFTSTLVACSLPADSSLEANFVRHQSDFERLVKMSNEDRRVVRIANDFTRLEDNWNWPRPDAEIGFSKARWDEYRSLFAKLGLEGGLERGPSGIIYFLVSGRGLATGGDYKGYAYSEVPIPDLYESLDDVGALRSALPSLQPAFKKIGDHWYLFYMWDD